MSRGDILQSFATSNIATLNDLSLFTQHNTTEANTISDHGQQVNRDDCESQAMGNLVQGSLNYNGIIVS